MAVIIGLAGAVTGGIFSIRLMLCLQRRFLEKIHRRVNNDRRFRGASKYASDSRGEYWESCIGGGSRYLSPHASMMDSLN